jgi:superfamily II DNA or RNA helicase
MNAPSFHHLNAPPPALTWQSQAVEFARDLLITQGAAHMYLCGPTGTGKSRAAFEIVEALDVPGLHYLTVGMKPIAEQLRNAFLEYGCRLVSTSGGREELVTPRGQRVIIETWQALAAMARRGGPVERTGFLIIDECHAGGSNADNVSFPAIQAHLAPAKLLSVSATPQTAAEELLGEKAGHSFVYTMAQAYEDQLLNPVDMVEVHAGTVGKIRKVETAFGSDMEQLQTLSSDDLHELAQTLKANDVAITEASVSGIIEHRHDVMIDLYFLRHLDQQAIFYTPSIQAAEQAADRFNRKAQERVRAEVIHSRLPNSSELIEAFRSGEVQVMFVVGMLQEGFDLPSLRLAFDCRFYRSWKAARIARVIQRVGRVIRVQEGKDRSLYYYARDITDFYKTGSVEPPDLLDFSPFVVEPELEADDDAAFVDSAAVAVARMRAQAEGIDETAVGEFTVHQGAVETVRVGGGAAKLVATSLYALAEVSDGAVAKTISFAAMFGRSAEQKKHALLAMAPGAARPPSRTVLGSALTSYVCRSAKMYDEEFAAAIRTRQPKWFDGPAWKKTALLDLPVDTPKPRKGEVLANALQAYTQKTHRCYDPDFDVAIRSRQPLWFGRKGRMHAKKEALIALPEGAPRPVHRSELDNALRMYTKADGRLFDAEFDTAIRARQPGWFKQRRGPTSTT